MHTLHQQAENDWGRRSNPHSYIHIYIHTYINMHAEPDMHTHSISRLKTAGAGAATPIHTYIHTYTCTQNLTCTHTPSAG